MICSVVDGRMAGTGKTWLRRLKMTVPLTGSWTTRCAFAVPVDPLRFCRNYRSVGLGIRRYWYFLFEYEGAINEIAFGYTKVIGILRAKDDRLFWVLVWVVKE